MTLFLSRPFEELEVETSGGPVCVHTLIVGSGYGAAFSALALATSGEFSSQKKIMVLERGNEFVPGDFPKTMSDLPAHISVQSNDSSRTGYADALIDFRIGERVMAIVGSGLGGTSLINAGVAVDPDEFILSRLPPSGDGESWSNKLKSSLSFARRVLQVQAHPRGNALPKVQALGRIAKSLGAEKHHKLADIAVSFVDGANSVGVKQSQCTDCGNCFTGCNIGAKNTLAMNAWPLAKSLGVDIISGGTVAYIDALNAGQRRAQGYRWRVHAFRTTDATSKSMITIDATNVILSAGTFGSTEILKRSAEKGLGVSSHCLGSHFSLNGDAIGFGFGQTHQVRAYAKVPSARNVNPQADERPGPTIVSLIAVNGPNSRALLEDATVPQAIARLWGDVLSAQAMTRPYVQDSRSAWHQANPAQDPLAVSPALLDHHQVVLGMASESVLGRLEYDAKYPRGRLSLHWPAPAAPPRPQPDDSWFEDLLSDSENGQGFDGGFYLSNPFFRPLPKAFDDVFEGASKLGGIHLCNHPLGGCPMGADATSGVVNWMGNVFSSDTGTPFHAGLFVLDGSILPGALGINPFMTISAIAHRLAADITGGKSVQRDLAFVPRIQNEPIVVPLKYGQKVDWPIPKLAFRFQERLFSSAADAGNPKLRRVLGLSNVGDRTHSIVIDAAISIPDVYQWLAAPSQPLAAIFTVYDYVQGLNIIDTVPDDVPGIAVIKDAIGQVHLFSSDPACPAVFTLWWRAALATWRFYRMRRDEVGDLFRSSPSKNNPPSLFSKIAGFWRVAKQHGHWRRLAYGFDAQSRSIAVHGQKTLAYDGSRDRVLRDESNPWTTLTNIQLTFVNKLTREEAAIWFRVDIVRMAKDLKPLQLSSIAETPQVAIATASIAFLALRVLLQTHLWSFGAPNNKLFPSRDTIEKTYRLHEPPDEIKYVSEGRTRTYPVTSVFQPVGQKWRLIRVDAKGESGEQLPALLIHGMAHSSRVFYTETVDRNLAGYLLTAGYEVWLLDHGLSIALKHAPTYNPTIDDISTQVTAAIRHVYDTTGKQVVIFSHCVGSAALSRSILLGDLHDEAGRPMIARLVMHAIPPWIYPSESNLLRAYIGVFFKDRFFPKSIDPISDNDSEGSSTSGILLDRLASSIPWKKTDFDLHSFSDADHAFGRSICNRMSAFYGYEWSHSNLDERTHRNLPSLVGATGASAFRQLYFLLNRKRITSAEGINDCLIQDKILRHWAFPTLFIHGRNNRVFDVESSVLSATQLTTLRKFSAQAGGPSPPVPVALSVIEGYGHMDLLFGKFAADVVFDHIGGFLGGAPGSPPTEQPRSNTLAPNKPMTGPVISNPTRAGNKHWIRAWVEANEFQTSSAIDVEYRRNDSRGPALATDNGFGQPWMLNNQTPTLTNVLKNSTFWLTNIPCDQIGFIVPVVINADPGIVLDATLSERSSIAQKPLAEVGVTIDWRDLSWFQRFIADTAEQRVAFVVGSCWHPASWFDHDLSDRVFARIRDEVVRPNDGVDSLLLVGDQIYADASYAIFDIAENRERYQESYRRAFNSPRAKWVLAHIPTYFAIDDHEFRDNYPTPMPGDKPGEIQLLGKIGAQEAWNFQMSHGESPTPGDNRLSYAFQICDFRFFVFDTRSERDPAANGVSALVGAKQVSRFLSWLASLVDYPRELPVFLVTGSPLAPFPSDELNFPARALSSDSLRAYPEFLDFVAFELSKCAFRRPVIWLSGDPHYSAMSRITIRDAGGRYSLNCIGIVASGCSVPLPFANDRADNFDWSQGPSSFRPTGSGIVIDVCDNSLLSVSRGHALRIDVSADQDGCWTLKVGVLDADRSELGQRPVVWTI